MAYDAFMSITDVDGELLSEGASSKESIGSYNKGDHEDEIFVLAYNQKIIVPTDDRNGQITGLPRHTRFTIKKFVDKSSPLLANALISPSTLEAELAFYRPGPSGGEAFYQVTLSNAKIVQIDLVSPNCLDPLNDEKSAYEVVHFTYERIEWEHLITSTTGTDDIKGRL